MRIYVVRNRENGKVYVGQTIHSLAKRWGDHQRHAIQRFGKSYLHSAIRKYGIDKFTIAELCTAESLTELNLLEEMYIKFFSSMDSTIGYNLSPGGRNAPPTERSKEKNRLAHLGRRLSAEHKESIRRGVTGSHWSEEAVDRRKARAVKLSPDHREKLSRWRIGRKMSDEHRALLRVKHTVTPKLEAHIARLAELRRGTRISEETRARMSLAQAKLLREGKRKSIGGWNKGLKGLVKMSEEARRNMSEAQQRRVMEGRNVLCRRRTSP